MKEKHTIDHDIVNQSNTLNKESRRHIARWVELLKIIKSGKASEDEIQELNRLESESPALGQKMAATAQKLKDELMALKTPSK